MSTSSVLSPFRHSVFRWLWCASFASNVGTWMHEVGAAWLMTSLSPTPFMVSLVQASGTLPIFLLALPSGALADLVDKRILILITQLLSALFACSLGILTLFGLTDEILLLLFTIILNVGTALTMPAWQGMTPELVPPEEIPPAIALGGISYNLSRIVGPALAGLLIAYSGPWLVFLLNGLSFLSIVLVLFLWRRDHPRTAFSRSALWGGVKEGAEFILGSAPLRAILIRSCGFFPFSTVAWALLPLYARQDLQLNAEQYGLLLGATGLGAVLGGFGLARLRTYISTNTIMLLGMVVISLHLFALSWLRSLIAAEIVMFVSGVAWTSVMLSFNISTLHAAPQSHRARASSYFLLVFMGGLSIGSAFWGSIAEYIGVASSFQVSGVCLLISLVILRRYRIE